MATALDLTLERLPEPIASEVARFAQDRFLSVLDAVCAEFDSCHDHDRQVYGAGHVAAEVRRRLREGEGEPVRQYGGVRVAGQPRPERPPVPTCAWCSWPIQECRCDGDG